MLFLNKFLKRYLKKQEKVGHNRGEINYMNKVLLKYGGTRVGDMFHAIPLLKALQDKDISVDLVHGKYESDAAKLLQYMGLVHILHSDEFIDGHINTDMESIKRFLSHIGNKYDDNYNSIIYPNPEFNGLFSFSKDLGVDIDSVPWATGNIPDVIVGDYNTTIDSCIKDIGEVFIGVQPASISGFKTYSPLYAIDYPADIKSFGFLSDKPIPNAIRIHGKSLIEVYEELKTCCMVISTHSAIGVLAYYLGIPQIFIHFWEGGLANLSKRENIVQLYEPTKSEIQVSLDCLWNKLNKKELVYE